MNSLIYKDHLKDERVNCYSIICTATIEDYLGFIQNVWKDKGGIKGQRSPLKTKSAQRIRRRMIDDLNRGTVIPPIVVGAKISEEKFQELAIDVGKFGVVLLKSLNTVEEVSIIDGMQRTTALYEATESQMLDTSRLIRLEFWIATSTNSLIYRMLVLNSGQIPWSIKRQLEVVFSQFRVELESKIKGLKLFNGDDNSSRNNPGEFQASQFIELFMLFGTKRINIDVQEELAEEFARLDIIETTGNSNFIEIFTGVAQILVDLDILFSKLTKSPPDVILNKFKSGKHIFSSQPARAGFIVAAAQEIFGLPGIEIKEEEQYKRYQLLVKGVRGFEKGVNESSQDRLIDIIDLATLDEQTNIKTSKVGEFERNFFLKSFKTFIELAKANSLQTLTACWRSSH